MGREKISIRLDLEGEEIEKLETVKKALGLKHYTEVIRALISEKYREILEKTDKRQKA